MPSLQIFVREQYLQKRDHHPLGFRYNNYNCEIIFSNQGVQVNFYCDFTECRFQI